MRAIFSRLADLRAGRAARRRNAARLYAAVVKQSRLPDPFRDHGVPDSFDGRFDTLCLHVFLVARRLGREGVHGAEIARDLYDALFADMDQTLREMGVGDLGVGRRVQQMAEALMGRAKAYGEALDAGDPKGLEMALRRNLYGTVDDDPSPQALAALAGYMRACDARLAAQDFADLMAAGPDFARWEGA